MKQLLRILFVEDNPDDFDLMRTAIENYDGFDVYAERVDTEPGLRAALHNNQWDGVVMDWHLPMLDFHKALEIFDTFALDVIFILVSGAITREVAEQTMKDPRIYSYLDKSNMWKLGAVFKRAVQSYENYEISLRAMAALMEERDAETAGHSERVVELSQDLARALGVAETAITHIRRGALLHDIGKIGIPDNILLKDGPLTLEEWAIMREHPVRGYNALTKNGVNAYLSKALEIVKYHHENFDGSGYPDKLKGEIIPLSARIFKVIDVYDSLMSARPYKPPWSRAAALQFLKEESGRLFDPVCVNVFVKMMEGR